MNVKKNCKTVIICKNRIKKTNKLLTHNRMLRPKQQNNKLTPQRTVIPSLKVIP